MNSSRFCYIDETDIVWSQSWYCRSEICWPWILGLTLCLLLLFLLTLSESPIIPDFADLCSIMYIIWWQTRARLTISPCLRGSGIFKCHYPVCFGTPDVRLRCGFKCCRQASHGHDRVHTLSRMHWMIDCRYHRLPLPWVVDRDRIHGISISSTELQDIFDDLERESKGKEEQTSSGTNYEGNEDVPTIIMAGAAVQGTCPCKALVNSKTY